MENLQVEQETAEDFSQDQEGIDDLQIEHEDDQDLPDEHETIMDLPDGRETSTVNLPDAREAVENLHVEQALPESSQKC